MSARRQHRSVVLAIILAGYLLVLIDVSILMAALPSIRADLGFSDTSLSWAQNAYTLTFGGLLLLGARAGDLLGRRRTFVLGIGMAWHPWAASAMDQLPSAINRLIALTGLAAIGAYLVWLTLGENRRELGQNGWKVVLPSARLTLVQILIGVVDLGFCAMAMYLLMPAQPGIEFISLAVVFILATLLSFASHAPGSIGVFDAAMLVALPEFGREQLLATLVVFRILYFVIPFGIAISILGTRELWLNVVVPWQKRRRLNEGLSAPGVVPQKMKSRQSPQPLKSRQPPQPAKTRKSQG